MTDLERKIREAYRLATTRARPQEAARAFTAVAATVRDRHGHRKAVRAA